jgi:hypothetical protein
VKRTKNNNRDPFGISESWAIWVKQIEQLKKRNDLLADVVEMPEKANRSADTESSDDNQDQG